MRGTIPKLLDCQVVIGSSSLFLSVPCWKREHTALQQHVTLFGAMMEATHENAALKGQDAGQIDA